MTTPYLTDAEILDICKPITQPAAMIRRLRDMGFYVQPRPNGWPLLSRANFDAVMMGAAPAKPTPGEPGAEPDTRALLDHIRKKGSSYADGTKEKKQPARAA